MKFNKWFNENINKFEFFVFSIYYIWMTLYLTTKMDDPIPRIYYDPITIWDTILLPIIGVVFPTWLGYKMAKRN